MAYRTRFDRRPARPRAAVPLEKVEQSNIERTFEQLGGKHYTIGTRRGHVRCKHCGQQTPEHQGTKQTPGIADVFGFIPVPSRGITLFVAVEVKRQKGGRASDEQREFRDWCRRAGILHVLGSFNEFLQFLVREGVIKPESVPHYRLEPTEVSRGRSIDLTCE